MEQFAIFDQDLSSEVLARYLQSGAIAVDTETMGLNPHRDRLCLVQLCDDSGYVSAIRIARGQTAAPNLKALMEAPQITKVFHFGRFDIAQLRHVFGIETQPFFCTKIASKLARTYTSSHGLKSLVKELMGIELDKSAQSSDWGNVAALTDEQLKYACNDVRYLIPMMHKLTAMLKREDRWELMEECLHCLPTFVSLDLAFYDGIFEH
ncbi:MAG: ribonuclease H-like domain-containing protein [Synechococcus sp.]|nr:ribonuclease H-like domain-containing protein [Synechococcus sp.]